MRPADNATNKHVARCFDLFHAQGMLIAIVNQKGGVGKTTLAVHLAAWHFEKGRSVAFIDADGQSSSTRWITAAGWGMTLATETTADTLIELATDFGAKHDLVVADGPASLSESTRALLLVADIVLIPCGVTLPELESTIETIRMLSNARRVRGGAEPDARLVLSRIRGERYLLTREAREAIHALDIPVCKNALFLREALADAPGQRTVVWKIRGKGRQATTEITLLLEEIDRYATTTTNRHRSTEQGTARVSEPSTGDLVGNYR